MSGRLDILDLGRGAVMALMALDHTRTFLTNVTYNPTDVTRTFPALFLTRWVSHFCTPFFLFLAGTGVYFAANRRGPVATARWLVTRGLVLVVLEFTVVRWGWYFNLDYRHTSPQILWAIGVSMIMLAPLVVLPTRLVGLLGLGIVALHNWAGPWITERMAAGSWIWALLYERGAPLTLGQNVVVTVNFPALPLFGLMAMGYGCGEVFRWPHARQRRACITAGMVALAMFLGLRVFNLYGDPIQWAPQATLEQSAMSFLVLTKHPLSWLMALATLGPGLLWLGTVRPERWYWRPLRTFGRVPLFFYLVHVPLIHALALVLAWSADGDVGWLLTSPFDRGATRVPESWGFGLVGVYVATILVLAMLYRPCVWYADLKARSAAWWLKHL